jgi:EipB-like
MRALSMCFLAVVALLLPQSAFAQIQPYRAEYALRLGTAVNAARVGSAVQDLTLTCDGWRLKRDVKGEIALSATWKMNLASRLDGEEPRAGDAFRFSTLQIQNGAERETHGKVQRAGNELRAQIVSPNGPAQFVLPQPTLMPVALIDHVVERLRVSAAGFPAVAFDAEATGETFQIDVKPADPGTIHRRRPADKPVAIPGKSWPVFMSFTRSHDQPHQHKPLFTISAQLFDSGVLDRLTVETPLATVTADLLALEMHKPPACPPSPAPTNGF